MDHANYEIGRTLNDAGEPLFVVEGRLLGTVSQVKALIRTFEQEGQANRKATSGNADV